MTYPCNHDVCEILHKLNTNKSGCVLLFKKLSVSGLAVLVGLEKGGQYKNTYNLCCERGKKSDYVCGMFCWFRCIVRALAEEFKIFLEDSVFYDCFYIENFTHYILHNKTPIFFGVIPDCFQIQDLNKLIQIDNLNMALKVDLKEIAKLDYFCLESSTNFLNKKLNLSSFLTEILAKPQTLTFVQNLNRL